MHNELVQLIILLSGASAVWLSQDDRPRVSKYACIAGMIGQPFWLYALWGSGDWGMLLLTCWYTLSWMMGVYRFWIRPSLLKASLI